MIYIHNYAPILFFLFPLIFYFLLPFPVIGIDSYYFFSLIYFPSIHFFEQPLPLMNLFISFHSFIPFNFYFYKFILLLLAFFSIMILIRFCDLFGVPHKTYLIALSCTPVFFHWFSFFEDDMMATPLILLSLYFFFAFLKSKRKRFLVYSFVAGLPAFLLWKGTVLVIGFIPFFIPLLVVFLLLYHQALLGLWFGLFAPYASEQTFGFIKNFALLFGLLVRIPHYFWFLPVILVGLVFQKFAFFCWRLPCVVCCFLF